MRGRGFSGGGVMTIDGRGVVELGALLLEVGLPGGVRAVLIRQGGVEAAEQSRKGGGVLRGAVSTCGAGVGG